MYGSLGGPCTECPDNWWCPGGISKFACPKNSSTAVDATTAASSQHDCICDAATYGPTAGPCQICPANNWCPGCANEKYGCTLGAQSPIASAQ
eukprot:2077239-Rhodomonas_salina.1